VSYVLAFEKTSRIKGIISRAMRAITVKSKLKMPKVLSRVKALKVPNVS
jgi:hypothetical protein